MQRHSNCGETVGEGSDSERSGVRRHIIRRPRLTRLLDEATATIVVLVAPAGYGKTTLVREWLEVSGQRGVWYHASPSSSDIAAFVRGIASAASGLAPLAADHIQARLTRLSAHEPEALANVLSEAVAMWPDQTWLVIDDYHLAAPSPAADGLVAHLARTQSVPLLITTRTRPSWATARRLIYGEVFEIGQNLLAMTPEEAEAVMSSRHRDEVSGLTALAHGWPAVIALAALAEDISPPGDVIPADLYEFLAADVIQGVDASTREGLAKLALMSTIDDELASRVLGDHAQEILKKSVHLGLLAHDVPGAYEMHPLLADFLRRDLLRRSDKTVEEVVGSVVAVLLARRDWDSAYLLLERAGRQAEVGTLLELSLEDLLTQGRLVTISQWVESARCAGIDPPVLELAEAEVAFRRGEHLRALSMSTLAAKRFISSSFASHAWYLAGQSASFLDDFERASEHYKQAESHAETHADLTDALWGQLVAALAIDPQSALSLLDRLATMPDDSIETLIRLANARASAAVKTGAPLLEPLEDLRAAFELSVRAEPITRSAFLNSFAYLLTLNARYDDALSAVREEHAIVEEHGLTFARPHVENLLAAATAGLRRFSDAARALRRARAAGRAAGDVYSEMNATALDVRLHLALGEVDVALGLQNQHWPHVPSPSIHGELLASFALAQACAGATTSARDLCDEVQHLTSALEAKVLVPAVRAVIASVEGHRDAEPLAIQALDAAASSGNFDSLIFTWRAHPQLLGHLCRSSTHRDLLRELVVRANDSELADKVAPGLVRSITRRGGTLTRRECDVLDLVARGMSNSDIARALYISESTAKVHVRHILEKLNARSRAEAAALYAADQI